MASMSAWDSSKSNTSKLSAMRSLRTDLGITGYFGPCPPPNTGAHHYVFTLVATDLEPTALPAGLTRDELLMKLDGHAKGASSLVALFGHP